uniref:Vitellogenin-1 n=1 Tax=Haemaphysalis flava TaxID=181088 RepID=A0A346JM05_HAEFA|nr:vitellogenin-1 [Haemaphysalis flava]
MRLLLGLAALAAVAVSVTLGNGYEMGREYVYTYYGHMHTEMPGMNQQVAGVVLKSKIVVQAKRDYLMFKVTDMTFDKVHKDVEDFEENSFNYRTIHELSHFMDKPFTARYEHGKVLNIQVTRGEPLWSINLKKAIVSLFNVDLEGNNAILPRDEAFYADIAPSVRSTELPGVYRIYEDGIYGECETLYDIQKTVHPENPFANVLNVTKIKNYKNCRNTPHIFFGVRHGTQCVKCEGDKTHPLTSNTAYHYDIRGTRHNFIIERAIADGEIMFSPYTPDGNIIRILLNRTLVLVETRDGVIDPVINEDLVTYTKLAFLFSEDHGTKRVVDLKSAHQLVATYGLKGDVDEVGRLFKNIVEWDFSEEDLKEAIKKDTLPIKFLEVMYSFVLLDYNQIDDFYHRFVESGSADHKEVFLSVLTTAGTNPSFMYAKHLIQSKKLTEEEASEVLINMPLHLREPTEILFDEFYRLCEMSYVKETPSLRGACLKAFSSLVYETCIVNYHNTWNDAREDVVCTPEVATKYFNYLVPVYDQDMNMMDKITNIKVAGNFAVKESLPYLAQFARDKVHKYPAYLRMVAIWSMTKAAFLYPEKVREILLPIYRNWTESHEIRLAAFSVMMRTNPGLYLLKSIAADIVNSEPNTQVITYVYTTFQAFAKSEYPCHFELSQHLRYVIPIIEESDKVKDINEWTYSRILLDSGYEPEYDYGGFTAFSYIMANDSYLPRTLMLKMNDYKNNFNYDTFTFTFDSWGLDHVLDKVYGPHVTGDVSPDRSLWNFFGRKRAIRDISVNKEVKEIDQNLHIVTRDYEEAYVSVRAMLYNNEVASFTLNQSMLAPLLTEGSDPFAMIQNFAGEVKDLNVRTYMMGEDMSMFLPTELGLPFYLEQKQPIFAQFKNKDFKFDVKVAADGKYIEEIGGKFLGHLLYDAHMIETASILLPFEKVSVGVGYDSRSALSVPFNFDAGLNFVERKFKLKSRPQIPHERFHYEFKPFSFVESFENALPVVHEETRVDIFRPEDLHKFEKEYLHDMLGMGVKVEGHYLETYDFWGSWMDFWYFGDFRQKYYYLTENPMWHPRKFNVMLTPANRDITNEIEIKFGWNFLTPDTRGNQIFTSKYAAEIGDPAFSVRDEARSYTTVIDGELVLRGQRERKIVTEMVYTRSRDLLLHNINFIYDRTPFTVGETDPMKVCFHGGMKFPAPDYPKIANLDLVSDDNAISTNFKINFGKDCKSDQKITMRAIWEHSEEQKHLFETRDHEEPSGKFLKNPYSELWKDCAYHKSNGILWSHTCDELYFDASALKRFTADIEYENLSKNFVRYMHEIRRHARYSYFPWLYQLEDFDVTNPEGKARIVANVSVHDDLMDVHVILPKEDIKYKQAPMPSWFITPRFYALFEYTNLEQYNSMYRHRICDAQGSTIRTFDEVTYELPDTDCYKVLAKDCSENQHFLILGTKTKNPKYAKAVRMFLHTFKIELLPVTDDSPAIARVNGKKVPVTPDEPFRQFIHTGVRDVELFRIVTYNDHPIYRVHSEIFGVRVSYDGQGIYIQLAPFYRGKVCGLCGDYNFNQFREFIGPDKCLHHNSTTFGNSYVIPSDNCKAPEYRNPCAYNAGEGCTVMRTVTRDRGDGKQREVCFSLTPLPKCSDSCVETRLMSVEMGFHCLPANDATTKHLLQQADVRPLTEFRRKRQYMKSTIYFPESCYRP